MSDFFGDDFTAELKAYFLDSLIKESDKFIDLIEDSLWKRIRSEVCEQTQAWAVDAKTNEFHHLKEWLEGFTDRANNLSDAQDLIKALKSLKSYAEALLKEKPTRQSWPLNFPSSRKIMERFFSYTASWDLKILRSLC